VGGNVVVRPESMPKVGAFGGSEDPAEKSRQRASAAAAVSGYQRAYASHIADVIAYAQWIREGAGRHGGGEEGREVPTS